MLEFIKKLFGGGDKRYQTIGSEAFSKAVAHPKGIQILDVRHKHEFDEQKIPNAMNMDVLHPNFKDKIAQLDKNKSYYVYCRSGARSAKACGIMADLGFTNVHNLKGGIMAYTGKTV
jgi:rhodanese-related sulfurtransferase